MKQILNIVVFLSFWISFSQVTFEKMPDNVKEIHFVYQVKSNYVINEKGVFADTLLLQIDFPKLKYSLKQHPSDSTVVCGFSTLKEFGRENKKKLLNIIYHTNEIINAIHFIAGKKTIFNVVRGDEETKMVFKKYFDEPFYNFKYRQEFDFIKRMEKRKYPNVNYDIPFDKMVKNIEFKKDDIFGFYYETVGEVLYKNAVFFNKELSIFVSPKIFENSKFGVEKIETIGRTITLKSVYYK